MSYNLAELENLSKEERKVKSYAKFIIRRI